MLNSATGFSIFSDAAFRVAFRPWLIGTGMLTTNVVLWSTDLGQKRWPNVLVCRPLEGSGFQMITISLSLLVALLVKHLLADFVWQTPFMLQHKGTYGHRGGVTHAGLHGALSFLVLLFFLPSLVLVAALSIAEAVLHYHIDWGKEQVVTRAKWPQDHRYRWMVYGLDQLLHNLTYVAMVVFVATWAF